MTKTKPAKTKIISKDQQERDKNFIESGLLNTPLTHLEFLDLITYNIYKAKSNYLKVAYPLVNVCLLKIQSKALFNNHEKLAEKFMIFAFQYYIKKNVMKQQNRMVKYFNNSINGSHIDLLDIFQEVYMYFFELAREFRVDKKVYFVWYLRRYFFYFLSNRFKMNKKEQIDVNSLDAPTLDQDNQMNTFLEVMQEKQVKNVMESSNRFSTSLELLTIYNVTVENFKKKVMLNSKHFKNKEVQNICTEIFTIYFVERQTDKNTIASMLGIPVQKVRYYLNKVIELYKDFS